MSSFQGLSFVPRPCVPLSICRQEIVRSTKPNFGVRVVRTNEISYSSKIWYLYTGVPMGFERVCRTMFWMLLVCKQPTSPGNLTCFTRLISLCMGVGSGHKTIGENSRDLMKCPDNSFQLCFLNFWIVPMHCELALIELERKWATP